MKCPHCGKTVYFKIVALTDEEIADNLIRYKNDGYKTDQKN